MTAVRALLLRLEPVTGDRRLRGDNGLQGNERAKIPGTM
jgi:hypothetical protein